MHCFQHRDRMAVGSCRHCFKGLCPDCATDLGHGLACKGVHEAAVENINRMVEQNMRIAREMPRNRYLGPGIIIALGLCFLGTGAFAYRHYEPASLVMGAVFLVAGAFLLRANLRTLGPARPNPSK